MDDAELRLGVANLHDVFLTASLLRQLMREAPPMARDVSEWHVRDRADERDATLRESPRRARVLGRRRLGVVGQLAEHEALHVALGAVMLAALRAFKT